MHLKVLDQTLAEWRWHEQLLQRGTMLADCQLWDMLNFADLVFGSALQLDEFPELQRHYRHCPGREVFLALIGEYPGIAITARPGEAEAIARIRSAVGGD